MLKIKNGRLGLYGAEHSMCDRMMTVGFCSKQSPKSRILHLRNKNVVAVVVVTRYEQQETQQRRNTSIRLESNSDLTLALTLFQPVSM